MSTRIAVITIALFSIAVLSLTIQYFIEPEISSNIYLSITSSFFLGIIGIASSAIAGVLYSRESLKNEIENENKELQGRVTAIAAMQLNNMYQNIESLGGTWDEVCEAHNVPKTTQFSVRDYLYGMKIEIQNNINTIVGMSGVTENPFRLTNFQKEIPCPTYECSAVIDAKYLGDYPRATKDIYCSSCHNVWRLRRRHDGAIDAFSTHKKERGSYPSLFGPVAISTTSKSDKVVEEIIVSCPNDACMKDIKIQVNNAYEFSNRGCTECGARFRRTNSSGLIEIIDMDFINIKGRTLENHFGEKKYRCKCDFLVGLKYLRSNSKGVPATVCHNCGRVLFG